MESSNRNVGLIKMALSAMVLQALFLTLKGLLQISTDYSFWDPVSMVSIVLSLMLNIGTILLGFSMRRAYIVHVLFSLNSIVWIAPLLVAGYQIQGNNVFLLFIFLFCFVNLLFSYKSTLGKMYAFSDGLLKTGRYDSKKRIWDLNHPMFSDEERTKGSLISQLLIPSGAGLGTFLYKRFTGQTDIILSMLLFFLACMLMTIPGTHIAIAIWLLKEEKKVKSIIVL